MKEILKYGLLLFSAVLLAQEKDKNLPKGNDEYHDKKYAEAEAEYRKSQYGNPQRATASYNLGNAIYKQKQPSEAKYSYVEAIENAKGKRQKHKAYHNLGNVLMAEKNYEGAVEAYKNALRNNPRDEETRYNYALAKQKLKQNPPKKDDEKKDKDKEKDKDQQKDQKEQQKDQKDQNQDKNKDKKDDPKNPEDKEGKGDENQQPQQPKPSGASKQRMENLLDAVNNEEKKIQEKVKGREVKGRPTRNEKDW